MTSAFLEYTSASSVAQPYRPAACCVMLSPKSNICGREPARARRARTHTHTRRPGRSGRAQYLPAARKRRLCGPPQDVGGRGQAPRRVAVPRCCAPTHVVVSSPAAPAADASSRRRPAKCAHIEGSQFPPKLCAQRDGVVCAERGQGQGWGAFGGEGSPGFHSRRDHTVNTRILSRPRRPRGSFLPCLIQRWVKHE
jgi:hypothetical protein